MSHFVLTWDTKIIADEERTPIRYAVRMLRRDMDGCLTGEGGTGVIRLAQDAALAAEAYRVEVNPAEMRVAYGGDLGAVYGLLSISERQLGIAPLEYWNETAPVRRAEVSVPCGIHESPAYAVRYRGWFVNDEVLLDGWKDTDGEQDAMWEAVFKSLLRCGGNMVIAGTDRGTDRLALLASNMGLWITHHHGELLGARMFGRVYPDLEPSYGKHPELFEGLWREAAQAMRGRNVLWAIGFRGQGDCAFWAHDPSFATDAARGAFISKIMRRQMEIVREVSPDAIFCTNLYGEMMGLYQNGHLDVPQDVIRIWADNGYGRMVSRRQGLLNPRVDSMPGGAGEHGIYYHASFYDLQAANHITQLQIPPRDVAQELGRVVDRGATAYWIINAGSIKPHVYILDLISAIWRAGAVDVQAHARQYAQAYYGSEAVGRLLTGYAEHSLRYGPHQDDLAGDQFYHFPLRSMAHHLLRGEGERPVRSLAWVSGGASLFEQAKALGACARAGIAGWEAYLAECGAVAATLAEPGAQLLSDTLMLAATIHLTGCQGLSDFGLAMESLQAGDAVRAFLYVHRALLAHRRGLAAQRAAEHGRFAHFYRNDCFTSIKLTVQVLEAARGWLRVCYDGENAYDWERAWLLPVEATRVVMLTHRTNQLTDEALAEALMRVVDLREPGSSEKSS